MGLVCASEAKQRRNGQRSTFWLQGAAFIETTLLESRQDLVGRSIEELTEPFEFMHLVAQAAWWRRALHVMVLLCRGLRSAAFV